MFDISWGELVLIGIVALIVIGPKELPGVLRSVGHWMGKIRRMASEFQDQFREAMREAELEELKKKVDDISSGTSGYPNFDPIGTIRKEFETAVGEAPHSDEKPAEPGQGETAAPAASPPAAAPEGASKGSAAAADATSPPPADVRKTGDAA